MIAKTLREETHDRDITLAWHTAALSHGTKGLPKLNTLLIRKAVRRQTPAEQALMWQSIALQFGGQFTPMDPAEYAKVKRG